MYYLYVKLRNLAIKIVNNCRIIYLIINLFLIYDLDALLKIQQIYIFQNISYIWIIIRQLI